MSDREIDRIVRMLSPAEIALILREDPNFTLPTEVPDRQGKMVAAREILYAALSERTEYVDERAVMTPDQIAQERRGLGAAA